jgi:hypothetical protein
VNNFMVGFAFCVSVLALVLAWRALRKVNAAFTIIRNRATRTVTVDMQDGKVTVIKESINDRPIDVK